MKKRLTVECIASKLAHFVITKRNSLDWTQNQLAQKAGLNRGTIAMLESRMSNTNIKNVHKILQGLNANYADLQEFLDNNP